jgi:hypothetical protein
MTDEQQLAEAFTQMHNAVVLISAILDRNPALAENVPIRMPMALDADEIAAECRILAQHYARRAKNSVSNPNATGTSNGSVANGA